MRVEIVVFDGFDELDAFGPFEVLSSAGFEVDLVVAEGPGPVRSMRGVQLNVPGVLDRPDGVIVVGGGWLNRAEQGSWAQAQAGVLPRRLAEVAGSARWMASVCTGAMLLGAAGLLTGRNATTNRHAYDELRAYGVHVIEERVVDDGDRVTAGALSAGIDLGLWLTEREYGTERAATVAATIDFALRGPVWKNPATTR
ncbi:MULTISPECIES: DJ-1/PfpI family protein [Micromonospora]|uniref:DJ-1/PfpI family protein n=1 Tax=Micromonospora TaxID=1873 RepID=UPI0008E115AB|nr:MULTISPECIES: DJ-1/PfpI family protein [Micromonospora]WFE47494.1 DJ-1/PfpI family protein [Verrucosispora sp. WMMD1129]SFD22482.1 DJ-1/PfpI family protein [Micromonospora sediminimaris]